MLPQTPFQQLMLPRLVKARERVQEQVWRLEPADIKVWQAKPTKRHRALDAVNADEFKPVAASPHYWGDMFDQCWWKVSLPSAVKRGEKVWLRWGDQGEATLYLGGVPTYGIDPGHHHAPLPAGCKDLVIESLCARTGIWVGGEAQGVDPARGSRFDGVSLARRDQDAWRVFHDMDVLMRVLAMLSRPEYTPGFDFWALGGYRPEVTVAEPLLRKLIDRLNGAVDVLDNDGLAACAKALRAIYRDFPADPGAMTALLTGHAHIDLVWMWPERAGDFKAVHTFANALSIQDQYPEMVFGYSQPASYEAVEKRSPALMKKVRRQIKSKRWEPTGALYVESDVQLPCGEALVRAFSLGQQGFRDLRGDDSRCVWIPDVFGYSAALPTIMAGFGVPYFYTTKLHWSGATRFPYSSFKWVGMDGSEVVSHISWNHYNQEVTPEEFERCAVQHRQSAVHDEGLFPCGYGDGGGGVTEAMCERARRLGNLASMPRAKWGTIEGFFDRLAQQSDRLPSWRGEMYLEFHRGVQTTHGNLKAAFRAAERGLQVWEAVRCATGGGPVDERMWKRVCFAQFHDYIPGSSIAEVYDEAVPELEGIARDALRHAMDELAATGNKTAKNKGEGAIDCVFNPLPIPRREVINDRLVELPPLAGVAVASLTPVDTPPLRASKTSLGNGRVSATFNALGEIKSLKVDGRDLALTRPAAEVWTFLDAPAMYDAWDIDRPTLSNGQRLTTKATVHVEQRDGSASVAFTRSMGGAGSITVTYLLEAGGAAMRINVDLDLRRKQLLVKLVFPTAYRGREARYGGPFGSTRRPQWAGPLTNEAMFENPASRWACASDDDERDGLMLISEAKYGFGVREGLLHVSLARSAKVTQANVAGDTTSLKSAGSSATYADLGRHHIRLAVGRFSADAPRDEQPAVLADTLFTPVLRYKGRPVDAGLHHVAGPASLVPCWAVPHAKKRWTLRLHETLGGRGRVTAELAPGLKATPTDLRGLAMEGDALPQATPYALMSLRIDQNKAHGR